MRSSSTESQALRMTARRAIKRWLMRGREVIVSFFSFPRASSRDGDKRGDAGRLFEEGGEDFAEFVGGFLYFVADEGTQHRGDFNFDGGGEDGGVGTVFLEVDVEGEGYGAAFGCEAYVGGGGALADAEDDLTDGGGVHADGFAVKFDSVEAFALFGGELFDEAAVLREVGDFCVDLVDGTGEGDGFAGIGCHFFFLGLGGRGFLRFFCAFLRSLKLAAWTKIFLGELRGLWGEGLSFWDGFFRELARGTGTKGGIGDFEEGPGA